MHANAQNWSSRRFFRYNVRMDASSDRYSRQVLFGGIGKDGQAALALAREYGARTVQETGAPQLNVALARATVVAKGYATRGVLIVPADLPLITVEDVQAMLERAKDPPVVVVADGSFPGFR